MMKRNFTFLIAAVVMLLTMMATTSEMWGQTKDEEVYKQTVFNSTNNSQGVSSYANSWYNTTDGFRNNITNANNNNNGWNFIRMGSKNDAYVGTIITNSNIDKAITKVVMTIDAITAANVNSIKLYTSSNGSSWEEAGTYTKATGAQAVALASPTASLYYKIAVDCKKNSNGVITISKVEYYHNAGSTTDPSITANDVNIAYNATEGSIEYTINNVPTPAGTLTAAIKGGTTPTIADFAVGTVTSNTVPFTCSANTTYSTHTATVTLTYTYGDNQTTTKDVVVTQAGNPDAYDNISSINNENTAYSVRGTVLAVSARAFVLGDGTGYVYYYNGYSVPSVSVGDKKIVQGTTTSYGHVIQFPSTATITATETSNYNNTPAATVITQIPDYTSGLHLSDYFQFEGTLTKSNGYYYVSCGANNINISYPSTSQQNAMDDLENKTVRVKGYFAGINSSNYFSVILESVEEVVNPVLSIEPATAAVFTYVVGNGPSAEQVFEVTGTNLTSPDITAAITAGTSYFEISDDTEYSSSVTIASGDAISIHLKAGLAKGSYEGTLTLSTEGASNVEVALNGSVTGQTYAINIDNEITGGTIEADLTTAEEGATVTLTATPDAAYNFGSWTVKDAGENSIIVSDNQFVMPSSNVTVTAIFTLKDTYAITCAVTPEGAALMEASPASAYEGQTVTLSYLAETGYSLSGIVITKTEDGSATGITPTASGDDYTFTMPDYAVTATATFLSDTYNGSFARFTGDAMEEGDYILVYNGKAVKNTVNNSKLESVAVDETNAIITDPSRTIVWHIDESSTENYWTIYNASEAKYIFATYNKTNVSMVSSLTGANSGAFWSVTKTDDTYDFRCKGNIDASGTIRYLRINADGNVFGNYASDNTNGPLTLYKYTVLTERTITFNGNGGETENEETTYTQPVYDGVETTLEPNQFTRSDYEFSGWNTESTGVNGTAYADEAKITVTGGNLTLYAQWAPLYNLTIDNNIEGGSVSVVGGVYSAIEGTEISLSCTPTAGHAFSAWNVYQTGNPTTTVTVTDNKFDMPAYNVTISATFSEIQTYSLVTNVNNLVSGQHFIIASGANGSIKAMGSQADTYRNVVSVISTNGVIPQTDNVVEFVIIGPDVDGYYTIYDATYNNNTGGYLYASSGNSNELKTQASNNNNGRWSISIDNTGAATINAQGTNLRNRMRFNGNRFACYGSNTSVNDLPYLYAKDNETTVSYTKNDIVSYGSSERGGYYLIAPPVGQVTPTDANGFLTNEYDLYAFDQSEEGEEWRNYKVMTEGENPQHANFSNLISGRGYLYANSGNVELTFEGYPYVGNGVIVLDSVVGAQFAGWNLIGNPFAAAATLNKPFYRMNTSGDGFLSAANNTAVAAMEGVFVKGKANTTAIFTIQNGKAGKNGIAMMEITLSQGSVIDNAIIRFDEGETLEKFMLHADGTKLYFTENHKDYAIVRSNNEGELPVNFKASKNGTYTLNVKPENVEVSYLHLIDNLTGANVDLLANPSYSFEANKGDNANRFRLVFKTNADVEENTATETFAYYNGSEWVINGTGNATLQVIDMMGRVLRSEQINGNTAINLNQAAGIYMLRLVNGENVMVQKVVVR